jgi:hypothetical protein
LGLFASFSFACERRCRKAFSLCNKKSTIIIIDGGAHASTTNDTDVLLKSMDKLGWREKFDARGARDHCETRRKIVELKLRI